MSDDNPMRETMEQIFTNRKVKECNRRIYYLSDEVCKLKGRLCYLENIIFKEFPHYNVMPDSK